MNKMLVAATLMTMLGMTGCAVTEPEPEAPAAAAADGPVKLRDQSVVTGSRIPGARSSMVSATDAADAKRQLRDNTSGFTHKE